MKFYLDASFLVAVVVDEARSLEARAWLKRSSASSIISAFAAAEVAAAISRGVRTRRFTEEQARAALNDFDLLRAFCDPLWPSAEAFGLAEELVRDFWTKLAAPDALHLASAMIANAALVTFDERLAEAARGKGMEVVEAG